MSRTDDILDAIDSAVADWTVSGDAVRITPGRSPEWTYETRDGSLPVVEVHRFGQPWAVFLADVQQGVDALAGFTTALRQAGEVAFREFGRATQPYRDGLHRAFVRLSPADARKHRPRCRTCNPYGNPRPLPINGHEYARRRRRRNRR